MFFFQAVPWTEGLLVGTKPAKFELQRHQQTRQARSPGIRVGINSSDASMAEGFTYRGSHHLGETDTSPQEVAEIVWPLPQITWPDAASSKKIPERESKLNPTWCCCACFSSRNLRGLPILLMATRNPVDSPVESSWGTGSWNPIIWLKS